MTLILKTITEKKIVHLTRDEGGGGLREYEIMHRKMVSVKLK